MTPVYTKDEQWYCRLYGIEFGPFPNELEAWNAYRTMLSNESCQPCKEE